MNINLKFVSLDTIDSTQDEIKRLVKNGAQYGMAISSLTQTNGRGRRGRIWQDTPGQCSLLSILLPSLGHNIIHHYAFIAANAAHKCIEDETGLSVKLKWPNDILVGEKKLGGILVELIDCSNVAVGVGINLNQCEFSEELGDVATSVFIQTGRKTDIRFFTEKLATQIIKVFENYCIYGFKDILTYWNKNMFGKGRFVDVLADDGEIAITGLIEGINLDGALIVKDACGKDHTIYAAECVLHK